MCTHTNSFKLVQAQNDKKQNYPAKPVTKFLNEAQEATYKIFHLTTKTKLGHTIKKLFILLAYMEFSTLFQNNIVQEREKYMFKQTSSI